MVGFRLAWSLVRRLTTAALLTFVLILAGFGVAVKAEPIRGAGSTFAAPLIARWAEAYEALRADGGDYSSPDWAVDYELVGSLGGVMRLDQPELDFAATDVPVAPADLAKGGRQQFPIAMGGIAMAINLDGIQSGGLHLTGPVLADIYLGRIRTWSDARIKELNPQVGLPDLAISVMHRKDGSGSTFVLTQYLSRVSADWKTKLGAGTLIRWPVGTSAEGTAALLQLVRATKGAIAYAEYGQVQRAQLPVAAIQNRSGKFVTPEPAGIEAAADAIAWSGDQGFSASLVDQAGDAAYPLSTATFAVVPMAGRSAERYGRVHDLFRLGFERGADEARALGYVPLSKSLADQIMAHWATWRTAVN